MSRPFIPRAAWRYSLGVGALCLVLSTELLFSPETLAHWTPAQVAAGWLEQLADTLFVGMLALVCVAGTDRRFQHDSRWRLAAQAAAATVAAGAGYAALALFHFPAGYYPPFPMLAGEALRAILLTVLFTLAWGLQRRAARAARRIRRLDLDRAVLHRRTEEARLKVLEAQIEPHFLFNTLATVKCLYQAGAADADRMLSSLQLYLGAALPRFRDHSATLASECALASAYLDILQIRMGHRLQFTIDVPADLAGHAVPPMMLLTLVENAIKHGLAPLAAGGRIDIRACSGDDVLTITVADNGAGFQASCGSGVGLVNIRARLRALHGERAALTLRQNLPSGVVASISVPLRPQLPERAPLPPGHGTPSAPYTAPAPPALTPAPGSWASRLRARWPHILLVGLGIWGMDVLRVLPIELELSSWLDNLTGALLILTNALLGAALMISAITAAEQLPASQRWRGPLLGAVVLLAAPLAGSLHLPLTYLAQQFDVQHHIDSYFGLFVHEMWVSLATGALLAAGFTMNERSRRAAARLWAVRSECSEAKRSMVESRLNILKARIEPALLIREIGLVQALYRQQHAGAQQQLENLIAYLQSALPHLHGGGATLGEELALAQAYLRLQAGNWGARLAWHIDVDPAMHGMRFPPMTLLPLIDDALRRAASAAPARLRLLVRLRAAADSFELTVEDDCPAVPPDGRSQDAMQAQARSFCDFYGQHGCVSREVAGNATRIALMAEIDADGLHLGVS